jgi:uncharacterized membrane protein YhaH (DUF805 family)
MILFYKKWRKIFWIVFALNALIALLQLYFAYTHLIKHEPWLMCLSLGFVLLNGYVAWQQIKRLQDITREEKALVFNILSTNH